MNDSEFDRALIGAAFARLGRDGWRHLSLAGAAQDAGLSLARARLRFPDRVVLLLRFGRYADAPALTGAVAEAGSVRDRLFDMLMRRIDVLQAHRAGVLALLRAVPFEPGLAVLLGTASVNSMRWLLEAAGAPARGPLGLLRAKGLLAVWLWTVRAWQRDQSEDLSATMAALDAALARAEHAAGWLPHAPAPTQAPPEPSSPEPSSPEPSSPDGPPAAETAPETPD